MHLSGLDMLRPPPPSSAQKGRSQLSTNSTAVNHRLSWLVLVNPLFVVCSVQEKWHDFWTMYFLWEKSLLLGCQNSRTSDHCTNNHYPNIPKWQNTNMCHSSLSHKWTVAHICLNAFNGSNGEFGLNISKCLNYKWWTWLPCRCVFKT